MAGLCEVALPVPLRTTFTYRVPDALEELVAPGARVLVPFRNRAMIGVVLSLHEPVAGAAPKAKAFELKDVAEIVDPLPALPPGLLELGRWVAEYYLAPVGDTFRMMLPPAVEMRMSREWQINEAGLARLRELRLLTNRSETEIAEMALLELCEVGAKSVAGALMRKLPGGQAAAARLRRRGQIEVHEVAQRRAARTQKIVAWRQDAGVSSEQAGSARAASARAGRERVRQILAEERGPLPLVQLLKLAAVSRLLIDRLARQGSVQVWEEPATEESLLEADFTPPSNVLSD
jgi:primosomal protein N' (replication factor Y)